MCELILIRHGETVGDSSVRLYGTTDVALSELGREQMRKVGEALSDVAFARVIASPLRRSRDSAEMIVEGRGPEATIVDEFSEIDFGAWEGWTLAEAAEREPEGYKARETEGIDFRFPGGDSKKEFFTRVARAAVRVFEEPAYPALAILHKGVIKGILAGLLKSPIQDFADHPIELGSIHRMKRTSEGWKLAGTNETGHLIDCRIPDSV